MLIYVPVMNMMQVTVVQIVSVSFMLDGFMAAVAAVLMLVSFMLCTRHGFNPQEFLLLNKPFRRTFVNRTKCRGVILPPSIIAKRDSPCLFQWLMSSCT